METEGRDQRKLPLAMAGRDLLFSKPSEHAMMEDMKNIKVSNVAKLTLIVLTSFLLGPRAFALAGFDEAKRFLSKNLDLFESKTIYCGCRVEGKRVDLTSCGYKVQKDAKRAQRMEWEHVVPAHAFGQSFLEWREGTPNCRRKGRVFKGRKCAETNPEFARMEGDLYNLFPEIGELNGLRSNYSMAEVPGPTGRFGDCRVKLADRKFEPAEEVKGIVARTYLHMEHRYPGRGIVSDKNRKLYDAWNRLHPISTIECRRWREIERIQGERHLFAEGCTGPGQN